MMLFLFPPDTCLKFLGSLGIVAAGVFALGLRRAWSKRVAIVLGLSALGFPLVCPHQWISPWISEYKGLSLALRVPNTEIINTRHSPMGWLAVVQSPDIPFRYAPGLSLNCFLEPPPQLGIFTDGDTLSPITQYEGNPESIAYLNYLSSALPYRLLKEPEVMILGAGGGMDVLMALYHRAKEVDAVEVNSQVVNLVKGDYSQFAGRIYEKSPVRVHLAEAREFAVGSNKHYDMIQISLLDSFGASISGAGALTASYLYTVEAFQDYYRRLNPGGILAITRWLRMPPRDALKLFGTAVSACDKMGIENPDQRLAMIQKLDDHDDAFQER